MKDLFLWLVVVLGLVILIIYGLTSYNESAANRAYARGQARAMIVEAQGQSRLDSAQANAVNLASMLPYIILGVVVVFGGAILILAVVILRQDQGTRIERIETRIILLPQGSKRQMYEMLCKASEVRLLKD